MRSLPELFLKAISLDNVTEGVVIVELHAIGKTATRAGKGRWMLTGSLIIALLLTLASLPALGGATPAEAQSNRVAIVFATGGLGDQSFNDSAFEGVQRAETELGVAYDYAEPSAIAEYETFLTRFAQSRRYDLIIAIGFDQADALSKVADRFPTQQFAIVDMVLDKPNVASYAYNEPERGFLVGAIAALMTERNGDPRVNGENVIGVVGGMDIPLINANVAGYIAGAKFVNSDVDVRVSYVGDWADPARGKELALAQFDQGVDVIWAAAGRSGLGTLQAAEEENKYGIGADSDQSHLAPDNILTNGMKLVNNTVFLAVQQAVSGDFQTGMHFLGVADGGLGYSESLVPQDIQAEVDALAERIARGELTPPSTVDAVDAWLDENR